MRLYPKPRQCRLFEVPAPQAANSVQELQIEKRHWNHGFASAHKLSEVRERCVLRWSTNFGKWALANLKAIEAVSAAA
jgi:hypothetical protein